jgi:WD40 repeat protein
MTLPQFKLTGHKARVTNLCFSANGKLLASSGDDGTARLWDVGDRMELAAFQEGEKAVAGVAFTPDGKILLSLTTANPAVILAWDVAAEKALGRITDAHPTAGGEFIAMAPDGSVFATADWDGKVKLWDTAARTHKADLDGLSRCATGLTFSPDGKYLAAAQTTALAMWVVSRAKSKAAPQLPVSFEATSVAFSPDGAWLAVAQRDYKGTMLQFDAAGGEPRAGFSPPAMLGYSVAYSPDGALLAYNGGQDHGVLLDAATGAVRGKLEGVHSSQDRGLAFSPDGKLLAMGSHDAILVFGVAKVLGG